MLMVSANRNPPKQSDDHGLARQDRATTQLQGFLAAGTHKAVASGANPMASGVKPSEPYDLVMFSRLMAAGRGDQSPGFRSPNGCPGWPCLRNAARS